MLMHECRVRRKRCNKSSEASIWKRNFFVSSIIAEFKLHDKRKTYSYHTPYAHTHTHTHVLLSFPFLRTECDKIDELRNRIYITGPIPYSCTLFFVSISHSVSRFIFIWNIQLTCAACLHSLYTVIHRFILSTQARTFHKNYQCLRTNSTSTRCLK